MKDPACGLRNAGGQMLLARLHTAKRLWPRFMGLMGKKGLSPGHGLYFPHCRSVHTFFMRFPLDLLFVDRALRVLAVSEAVRPWSLRMGPRETFGVIEAVAGGFLFKPEIGERLEMISD